MRVPALAVVLVTVALTGCAPRQVGVGPPEPRATRPNVLLITIDSLRPDHLEAYGYPRATGPTLAALARQGVRFAQVINQASWTSAALVSVLTGLYPSAHGADGRDRTPPSGIRTPLHAFREAGYRVPALSYLTDLPEFQHLGFEPVADRDLERWLTAHRAEPFFVWVHLEGPHLPLNPQPPYDRMFAPDAGPWPAERLERLKPFLTMSVIPRGSVDLRSGDLPILRALYDGKIRQTDDEVEAILNLLDRLGLRGRTLVVVTADHGEELGERGFVGHASTLLEGTLHDELIRVPLILSYPAGLPTGLVVTTQVEGIDLMPTLLELLKIRPPAGLQGRSWLPLIHGRPQGFREEAFAETSVCGRQCPEGRPPAVLQTLRVPPWKLIRRMAPGGEEDVALYDLERDPQERHDVGALYPGMVEELSARLLQKLGEARAKGESLRLVVASRAEAGATEALPAPQILRPHDGARLGFAETGGRVILEWDGNPAGQYVIEYEVGQGAYYLRGTLPVQGPRKEFGPLPPRVWALLPQYNPFRVRVRAERCQEARCWSPWVRFGF